MINTQLKAFYLNNFQLSIFKKKNIFYIYIYNTYYYSLIKLSPTIKLKLKNQKYFELSSINLKKNELEKYFKKFLVQFYLNKYSKIKFSGKGYKIKKNSLQSLTLLFNRSHLTTVW